MIPKTCTYGTAQAQSWSMLVILSVFLGGWLLFPLIVPLILIALAIGMMVRAWQAAGVEVLP